MSTKRRFRSRLLNRERGGRCAISANVLNRADHVYAGKKGWTLPYRRWLTTVRFDHPVQQVVLQDYIRSVHDAAAGYAVAGALFDPRERRLMERLEFDLLFRCFVGLGVDVAGVGSLDVFCRNRW